MYFKVFATRSDGQFAGKTCVRIYSAFPQKELRKGEDDMDGISAMDGVQVSVGYDMNIMKKAMNVEAANMQRMLDMLPQQPQMPKVPVIPKGQYIDIYV